ncbi:MAG TPA: type 4a pilus biogenesis protein PilO [Tepidisphaeraceae bacterium]|nr:type 4a pilus biogenesis protein PilO [Tepidisphaeraceae bacterium]
MTRDLQARTESLTKLQYWFAGVLAVLALGFYLVIQRPSTARAASLQSEHQQHVAELQAAQARAANLPTISAENAELSLRLARSKRLPRQSEWADLVRDITRLSNQSSLKKFSYKYGLAKRSSTFSQLPIMLEFEGEMMDVYAFVRQIEELPRMTRLRGISIISDQKTGQVRVEMALNTFFSTEP